MTNIEKNALRIADNSFKIANLYGKGYEIDYRDYNGLMPIVFECNNRNKDRIDIGIRRVSLIYVNYVDFTKKVFSYNFLICLISS